MEKEYILSKLQAYSYFVLSAFSFASSSRDVLVPFPTYNSLVLLLLRPCGSHELSIQDPEVEHLN